MEEFNTDHSLNIQPGDQYKIQRMKLFTMKPNEVCLVSYHETFTRSCTYLHVRVQAK